MNANDVIENPDERKQNVEKTPGYQTLNPDQDEWVPLSYFLKLTGIKYKTYYDWAYEKSPRYDPTLPKKYLFGPKTIRFKKSDCLAWCESKLMGDSD